MKRILYADDEDALLLAFSKLLSGPGIEIDTAQSASEAEKLITERSYDVLIVDLRMAGSASMDGLEVIACARKHQSHAAIIVLTAYGDTMIRENVLNSGASYYFEKPVSPHRIRQLLGTLGFYSGITEFIFSP